MRRRQLLLASLAAAVVCDLGRSLWARAGYAHPGSLWKAEDSGYAVLSWPPGLAAAGSGGNAVYLARCAVCHGPEGKGNGPAAPSLIPRPRDFTSRDFHYKSTPTGSPPLDSDLERTIREGLPGSAMPAFGDLLSPEEIRKLVEVVKGFARFTGAPPAPIVVPPRPPVDAASIERGKALFKEKCLECHSTRPGARQQFFDSKRRPVFARDLTAPWTFRRGAKPEEIFLRISTGMGPMPSFEEAIPAAGRWDLVAALEHGFRPEPGAPGSTIGGPGASVDLQVRGEYFLHAEMCGLCHTQVDGQGVYRDELYLAGGMRVGTYPHGVFLSRNLTSDPESGLQSWSDEQVIAAFRNGRSPTRLLDFNAMPWEYLHSLHDEDARALVVALRRLPPAAHPIPLPLRFGFLETIPAKLRLSLPAAVPKRLTYAEGDFSGSGAPRVVDMVLAHLEGLSVMLLIALLAAGRAGWPGRIGSALGLLALAGGIWVFCRLPDLPFLPPEKIADGATASIPPAKTEGLDPAKAALVERGRYLFTVASCALCHGNDGAGGSKVSWRAMGTAWAANLTPDEETGLARWSDAEIERAIRSGITREGRQMHWQAMPWDHFSNFDEEDLRALVAWLRTLPPLKRAIPAPQPPSQEDCPIYTFFPGQAPRPRCQ